MPRIEHIGFDVDGVLRDLAGHLVAIFEREFPHLKGRHLPIDQWPDWWGFERYFPEEVDFAKITRQFLPELLLEARPYPDVPDFLERMAASRTIHIVSSQPSKLTADLTREWIIRCNIPVPPERVHITSSKDEAPVQLLVDDMHHNLEAVQLAGIVGVCLDRPWNQPWEGFRIHALGELDAVLEALEREG